MEKSIISEINRVKEIMGIELIGEQKRYSIGKTVISGDIDGGKPINIVVDRESKYKAMSDDANDVGEPFFWTIIEALENEFRDSGGFHDKKDKIQLTKATIRSGASNYYNGGSTYADVTNDRFSSVGDEQDVKWDENSKPYKDNLELAKRRGVNFLKYIKEQLGRNGLGVLDPLESEDVVAVVVDTGGVIDEKRDESKYKNPGQFITMDIEMKMAGVAGRQTSDCLVNLKVSIGYFRNPTKLSDGKKSSKGHTCDQAVFDVFLNKKYIMTANLNNKKDPGNGKSKDYRTVNPTTAGGNVVCSVEIDNELAQKIMSETTSETITIGVQGKSKNVHAEVPMVILEWDDGKKWVGEPNVTLERGDTSYQELMPFDVCKKEVDA